MRSTVVECARSAGKILLQYSGKVQATRVKEGQSSVVTDADLASEQHILRLIRTRFPDDPDLRG